jgi:hypothetical protein
MNLLGMKRKLLPLGNAMDSGGGGGGSSAPQTSTTNTSNLPEYAKPYFERGMERAESLSQEGYVPYGGQRLQGFTPQQENLFQQTYGLQRPGQFNAATDLAGVSSLGSLGAGQQYAQNVTSPGTMEAYMSPYQQSVTDVAKAAAVREAQMVQNAQNLASASSRQGTYGGARQLLAQTEREKNLLSNLSNIQAKGSQAAYDQAIQSQQFGASLGLQGYGQALQGAGTLGQLGKDVQATDLSRLQAQQAVAGSEQTQRQKSLDMAYQDFLAQREFPYRQLEFYNAMLRGLPVKADTSSSSYQAQPNVAQQVLGYGIPALALSKAFS